MKKIWVVMIGVCVLLTGCGNNDTELVEKQQQLEQRIVELEQQMGIMQSQLDEWKQEKEAEAKPDEIVYYTEYQGKKVISKAELESYYESIELTLENWEEYFETYEKADIREDGFGEPTGTEYYELYLRLKEECQENMIISETAKFRLFLPQNYEYSIYEDGVLTFTHYYEYDGREETVSIGKTEKSTGLMISRAIIVNNSETSYTVHDLSDLKLLKIAGSLAKVQIPDEVWNVDDEGQKFLIVELESGHYCVYYENGMSVLDLGESKETTEGTRITDWNLKYLER